MPQHLCGCWPGLAEDTTLPVGSSSAEDARAAGDRQMAPVAQAFVNNLVTAGSSPALPFPLPGPRNMGIRTLLWQGWAAYPFLAAIPFIGVPSKEESLAFLFTFCCKCGISHRCKNMPCLVRSWCWAATMHSEFLWSSSVFATGTHGPSSQLLLWHLPLQVASGPDWGKKSQIK